MAIKKSTLYRWAALAVVVVGAYFIMVEVQTRLGEKALAATGLTSLPLEEALARATTDNKLVLADMSAIWCPTCRALDKTIFVDPAVKTAITEDYVFSRIEYESPEGRAFMDRYGVDRFPTLLLLHADGEIARHLPVTTDPAEFLQALTAPAS
ncbi:MAG: thioredoxin family protein [Opitutaceae bacterium]